MGPATPRPDVLGLRVPTIRANTPCQPGTDGACQGWEVGLTAAPE